MQALARALADRDLTTLFAEASALYRDGFAPRTLAERLTLELRSALYTLVGLETGESSFSLSLDEDALLRTIHALDDEMDRFVRYDDLFSLEVALIKAGNVLAHNVPRPPQEVREAAGEMLEHPAPQPTANTLPDFDPTGRAAPVRPTPAGPPTQPPPAAAQPTATPTPERP